MYDSAAKRNEVIELDFRRLLSALGRKSWLIALVAVLTAAAVFLGTWLLVTPKYQSSVMFYVNNNSMSLGDGASGITSSDISASQSLVSTYIVILETWETMTDVINHSGVDRSYEELSKMVTAEAVADTQVFRVVVTSPDAREAWDIASAITKVLPQRISGIIEGTSAQMVDSAQIASRACAPNYGKNTLIGFLAGLVLTAGLILLWEIFDVSLRTEEDIRDSCGYPVLAVIPEEEAGRTEAFRLLCTRLRFVFAGENRCRVLGISGPRGGEGISAGKLAQTLGTLGSRVLLMECDLRRPGKQPGLSDYLAGQSPLPGLIRARETESFHRLGAGHGSLTPAELLGSEQMQTLLAQLRKDYDYILLELPGILENTDALAASRFADGMLLTLRQKRSSRTALQLALDRLESVGVRVLGLVYHCRGRKHGRQG